MTAVGVIAALLALVISSVALTRSEGSVALDGGAPAAAGEEVAAAEPLPVTVDLVDFDIIPETIVAAPDAVLQVANDGQAPHNLKIKGQEEAYGTPDLNTGQSDELSLAGLAPGEYPMYCSIVGHEAIGMTATLVIDPAAADVAAADTEEGADADDAAPAEDGSDLTGVERAEWLRANYEESVSQFPAETSALGSRPMEPEVMDDGTKVFELTIDETEWEVSPGEFVEAVAYNGQVPGPWIQTEVGDDVLIRVINEIDDEATTLHPHGVFMHPFEVDGVGMISMDPIMPGEVWEASFTTQEVSVGMYHGHDNGQHQVINGAFGAFTVGDLPLPPLADNVVSEQVMVLNDAGNIGLTLNGKSFPATEPYVLVEGEQMLMHFYNEGLSAHPMHLHNNAMMVVAKDGYPLASPVVMDTVNVAPGERYSVVVFAEAPGTWVFHCHILTHVERDDGSVFGMFTALIVEPSDDPAVNDDLGRLLGRGDGTTFPGQTDAATQAAEDAADGDATEADATEADDADAST